MDEVKVWKERQEILSDKKASWCSHFLRYCVCVCVCISCFICPSVNWIIAFWDLWLLGPSERNAWLPQLRLGTTTLPVTGLFVLMLCDTAHCFVHLWLRVSGQRVYEGIVERKEWRWRWGENKEGQRWKGGAKGRKKINNRMGMRAKRWIFQEKGHDRERRKTCNSPAISIRSLNVHDFLFQSHMEQNHKLCDIAL